MNIISQYKIIRSQYIQTSRGSIHHKFSTCRHYWIFTGRKKRNISNLTFRKQSSETMEIWICVSKNGPPAQPLTNIMDINTRKVFMDYINGYLKDIMSKKLIFNAKYAFLSWSHLYFDTILGYFYGQYMKKTRLYQKKIQFYSILCIILVLYRYNIALQINIISFESIYWVTDGVFIYGYNFCKKCFFGSK
eukprot:60071_1